VAKGIADIIYLHYLTHIVLLRRVVSQSNVIKLVSHRIFNTDWYRYSASLVPLFYGKKFNLGISML